MCDQVFFEDVLLILFIYFYFSFEKTQIRTDDFCRCGSSMKCIRKRRRRPLGRCSPLARLKSAIALLIRTSTSFCISTAARLGLVKHTPIWSSSKPYTCGPMSNCRRSSVAWRCPSYLYACTSTRTRWLSWATSLPLCRRTDTTLKVLKPTFFFFIVFFSKLQCTKRFLFKWSFLSRVMKSKRVIEKYC